MFDLLQKRCTALSYLFMDRRGFETKYARYDLTHLKVSAEMARGVAVAVADFRDFLMERSIPNLVDKVMDCPVCMVLCGRG